MPFATNDGLKIHYEVEGRGDPLVLYHGLTGSGERWQDTGYTTGLGDTYRLILIDARGHGKSDKPRDPAAYGRRRHAADGNEATEMTAWAEDLQGGIEVFVSKVWTTCRYSSPATWCCHKCGSFSVDEPRRTVRIDRMQDA